MKKRLRTTLDWDLQLPDFAAPGVLLRVVLLANLCMLMNAILRQDAVWAPYEEFLKVAAVGEPSLVMTVMIMSLLWARVSQKARSFIALFTGAICVGLLSFFQPNWSVFLMIKSMVNSMIVSVLLCLYFDWRYRRLSPAVSEAKLDALVSRMRPHFLFNAINGIVMLLNKSPADAEEALLDLADVFRALLKEGSSLVKIKDELALTEKYLRIEKMRFRERLELRVKMDASCADVLIPTMLLQPLAENAVIHGIEAVGSGVIDISAFVKDERLTIIVENPYGKLGSGRPTNGIATENIKQRLSLIYDIEAKFTSSAKSDSVWRVMIQLPAHKKAPKK